MRKPEEFPSLVRNKGGNSGLKAVALGEKYLHPHRGEKKGGG